MCVWVCTCVCACLDCVPVPKLGPTQSERDWRGLKEQEQQQSKHARGEEDAGGHEEAAEEQRVALPELALEDGAQREAQHLRGDGQGEDERGVGLACNRRGLGFGEGRGMGWCGASVFRVPCFALRRLVFLPSPSRQCNAMQKHAPGRVLPSKKRRCLGT